MKVKLGEICEKASSNIAQKDIENNIGQYPIYGASGLIRHVDFYHQEQPCAAVVKDGAGVGRVFRLPAKSSVIGTLQYIIPKPGIDVNYLCYALESMNLARFYTGATIPHIYFKDYCNTMLQSHTFAEQRIIGATLDKTCGIIEYRKQQLQKVDELVKARFVEMFGDPKRNPCGYPVHQLSEYILYLTSGSRGWAQFCNDNGSEWFITIKNVKDCQISTDNMQAIDAPDNAEAKRTRVQEGDLLISITADLGRTGVVTKKIAEHGAYINQHLTCIRLDRMALEPLYVAYFMESAAGKEQFEAKNQNGVKAGLNFNSINSLKLLVPPLDIQREFLCFVSQVDKSKMSIQASLDQLETLKQSLMQKYFG